VFLPGLPVFAVGKSFGGRLTSQAQALEPMHGIQGLVFLGSPLLPRASVDGGLNPRKSGASSMTG
jgi:predicted alpha/beta-hydrolase family hydrolase